MCFVLMAVAAFIFFTPVQSEDTFGDDLDIYTVSSAGLVIGYYEDLATAFDAVNDDIGGSEYTITVAEDDPNVSSFELSAGKSVTLRSSDGNTCVLKIVTAERHGIVHGNLTLENIVLDGNETGGGIVVETSASLTMNEGAVMSNNKAIYGGAVYNNGTFTLDGGLISENEALRGGGVYNNDNSIFTMESGSITDNKGKSTTDAGLHQGGGAGVYNNNATFIMKGGEISYNELVNINMRNYDGGGGVYNFNSTFTMESGLIYENWAIRGGGVYNFKLSVFTMGEGAVILSNTAMDGGGVYNSGELTMGYGAKISENNATTIPSVGGGYGGGIYNIRTLVLQDGALISKNNASLWGAGVYSHGFQYVDGIRSIATVTMIGGEISGNISIGNGAGVASVYYGKFDMSGGVISDNTAGTDGGGVCNNFYSEFNMTGGVISDNTAGAGGGVHNFEYAKFNMSGGEISDNNALARGGGVCNYIVSEFKMTGGMICGNNAPQRGGGVYNASDGKFDMSGGEISDNTAADGGGVYNIFTFTMSADAVVSNNTADYGGGVYNTGTLVITGGSIIGNTANGPDTLSTIGSGGGIYTSNFANLTVANGVVFSDNMAPTLRMADISGSADADNNGTSDLTDYASIGTVVLNGPSSYPEEKNAPAYNNYDINYPGGAYIVFIDIEPNGSGEVTVTYSDGTDIRNWTMTSDGYFFVPFSVNTINVSATPNSGNIFIQFTVNGDLEIDDDSTDVQILGNTKIVAKFSSIPAPPNNYIITATADEGSTITPDGTVKVPQGEDKKFTFSPKSGYRIKEVYVDGVALSSEERALGEYTFTNVMSNHTISVVSVSGRVNPDAITLTVEIVGGTGTAKYYVESTLSHAEAPYISFVGSRTIQPNSDLYTTIDVGDGYTFVKWTGDVESFDLELFFPDVEVDIYLIAHLEAGSGPAGGGEWALLNLIFAILALLAGIIAVIAGRGRTRRYDEEKLSKTALILRLLAIIIGIVSIIIFLITEDMSLPMVIIDKWTLLMLILLLVNLIAALYSFRLDEPHEKDAEDEEDTSAQGRV